LIDQLAQALGSNLFWPVVLDAMLTIAMMLMMTVLLFRFYGLARRRQLIVSS
jgi:hypothetical protein